MLRSKNITAYLLFCSPLLLMSCASEIDEANVGNIKIQQAACSTHQETFDSDVWPVLVDNCFSCHKLNGVSSDLVLLPQSFNNYSQANFNTFQKVASKTDSAGISLLISKPINSNNDHGGGKPLNIDSVEHNALVSLVDTLSNCSSDTLNITDLDLGTNYQRLRKTTLALAGRLPLASEELLLETTGEDLAQKEIAIDSILDSLLTSPYYFNRLKIMFNDLYLLDAFQGRRALGQFDLRNYTNENYFDSANLAPFYAATSDQNIIRNQANRGLSQAPFELIAHVARENRPFTEILTANYVMVNPYSATIYGADVGDPGFNFQYGDAVDLHDESDFREAILIDENSRTMPTAGILTSHSFLRRYPTTRTNRNRARSRVVYSYFLDINVLGLASRESLDLDNVIGTFPTYEDPQCRACHDTVDPIAGLYKNWRTNGSYVGDNQNWFDKRNPQQILAPGFSMDAADLLPTVNSGNAVQWLSGKIADQNGFASRVVKIMFTGLTGQDLPLDFNFVELLKTQFVDANFNIKVLTKNIVNSPYFLARNASPDANPDVYPDVGMGRLLTPELLDQKIRTLTDGYRWRSPSGQSLSDIATYKSLYGGIDSRNVLTRTTDPTSLMAGIQQQIANRTACKVVSLDFDKANNRILFPLVEINHIPDDAEGTTRIKSNIVYLYKHLLGEIVSEDSIETTRAYDLFVTVRDLTTTDGLPIDCRNGLVSTNPVRIDAEKTVRSWMAVTTYMLSDYQFLYE